MNVFFWAPMGAAGLHIIEEFIYPGGFAAWDRRYRPVLSASITPRFHIVINGLLLLLCYNVGAMGGTPIGIATWLTVAALLFSNAIWHVVGAVRTGPGRDRNHRVRDRCVLSTLGHGDSPLADERGEGRMTAPGSASAR